MQFIRTERHRWVSAVTQRSGDKNCQEGQNSRDGNSWKGQRSLGSETREAERVNTYDTDLSPEEFGDRGVCAPAWEWAVYASLWTPLVWESLDQNGVYGRTTVIEIGGARVLYVEGRLSAARGDTRTVDILEAPFLLAAYLVSVCIVAEMRTLILQSHQVKR